MWTNRLRVRLVRMHLAEQDGAFRCPEGHRYTVIGLALTTNISAVPALWMAIRALEDDAGSLRYMASQHGDTLGMSADERRREAAEAMEAAETLRAHAQRAQNRLDALPSAPSAVREDGSQKGRGG